MISKESTVKKIQKEISSQKYDEAIKFIEHNKRDLVEIDYWYYLSLCARYSKKHNEALVILNNVIKIDPSYARAYQEFGHNYFKLNNYKMSLKSYLRAVRYNPTLHASWLGILGIKNVEQNIIDLATQNVLYLKNLPPELKSVSSFIYEGKYKKADHLCRDFLKNHPHHIEAMRLLAKIGKELHVYDDSEFLLESCLMFDKDNFDVALDYIDVLIKRQKYAKALEEAEKLYTKDKDNLRFMIAYAVTLQQTNKQEEALELYNKILNIDKKNPEILVSKGHLQKTFGDLKGSIDSYKNSYKIDQYYGDAYWSLANLKTYQFNDEEIMQLEKMTQDEFINDNEKIYMSFALGKAFEDRGEYDKSFTNYQNGNSLKKEFTKFDLKLFDEECKNQKEVCTSDLFDSKADWGLETKEPIFVLGLPRVGSTLIEQILASHSMVEATHELPNILALSHKLNLRKVQEKTSRYPEILLSLSAPQLKMIGEQYIKDAEIFRTNKPFFIDKMPNNFRHIGLIKLILPNAKIIDIRRNSMSACFSCYKQLFAEGQEFTYDFGDLAGYYNNYVELMEHWNQVLPNQILSIKYEDLVNDFENSVNKILNYCNLDFEDECLSFYKNKRSVRTPSSEQVRQPIYKKGLDYWKNYDVYLGDLKRDLKY
jgi:tetratricopeptide (TPR) repeat protein